MLTKADVSNAGNKRARAAIPIVSLGLLFGAASVATGQDTAAPTGAMHYTVKHLIGINGVDALEVKVRFVGNSQGQSIFKLPSDAMGGHERWTYLSQFEGRHVRIIASDKDKRIFQYRPGAAVTVRYRADPLTLKIRPPQISLRARRSFRIGWRRLASLSSLYPSMPKLRR